MARHFGKLQEFVQGAEYGTKSQTVLLVRRDGSAELRERSRIGGPWQEVQHTFKILARNQCGNA